jgi:ATP-dependent helicase/nuclease subunit A
MDSHPGAGKSTATGKAVARLLYQRYLAGDPTPERRILAASFSKEDAASIVPDVIDWLWELYNRREPPVNDSITRTDVYSLERRLRRDGTIGTIDGLLRSVLEEFATEVGFESMPAVGNEALITQLRRDCYDELLSHSQHESAIKRLEDAYPSGEHVDGLRGLLFEALETARRQCLSIEEFCDYLRTTLADVYSGGQPGSIAVIRKAVRRFRGPNAAHKFTEYTNSDLEKLTSADKRLYEEWQECIEDFADILSSYRDQYDSLCRNRGVISHTDCAHWVYQYFATNSDVTRDRICNRFRSRIESVVLDEAQDISTIQHAALSHIVTPDMRVLLVGDRKQCIYTWRSAHPSLFETAVHEGTYLGTDWETHISKQATQNYRSRPDIVGAINTVAHETLPDETCGDLGKLDVEYPALRPTLEGTSTPSVHVAQFNHGGKPGSECWVTDDGGEADAVASLLAGGLEDGTFETPGEDSPGITLVFRRTKYMSEYREALESRGISVSNARVPLFDTTVVQTVVAVLRWLRDPMDPNRTEQLFTEPPLAEGLEQWADRIGPEWDITEADSHLSEEPTDGDTTGDEIAGARVIRGLQELASDLPRWQVEPAAVLVREIIDSLALARDPLEIDVPGDSAQRHATLDAFIQTVEEWEDDDRFEIAEIVSLLDPFIDSPQIGPDRPPSDDDADVILKTIHQMKGDQDEIIVLADPAGPVGSPHPRASDRLVTTSDAVGLAPPTNLETGSPPSVPGFDNGLYDPDASDGADIGLRWTNEHWVDDDLRNYNILKTATAERRAEEWRLLFVAMSRAQYQFVVPLPASRPRRSRRDCWATVLYDAFELDQGAPGSSHTVSLDDDMIPEDAPPRERSFRVAVNDVRWTNRVSRDRASRPVPPVRQLTDESHSWIPQFVRPSTFYPLATNTDDDIVNHFIGEALHTETERPEVDLPFDAVGPEAIGHLAHDIISELATVTHENETTLNSSHATTIINQTLRYHAGAASERELAAVREFLETTILPQYRESGLQTRIAQAAALYRDEPLESVTTIDDIEVEIHGEADFLMEFPDGSWAIEDAKIALTTDDAAETRYQVQLATYEWAFRQQVGEGTDVTSRLSTFGSTADETERSLEPTTVTHILSKFCK